MYNKVSDLLPLKTLPKVLRASVGWWSGSADTTVDNHELFIVKGWKRKLQKKVLKVYNPVTKMKKELPEACECMHVFNLIQLTIVGIRIWNF